MCTPLWDNTNKTVPLWTPPPSKLSPNNQSGLPIPLQTGLETDSALQCFPFNANELEISQYSCRKVKKRDEPKSNFDVVCSNYRNEIIGTSRRSTRKIATILDTGFWPSFIKKDVLQESLLKNIPLSANSIKIREANHLSVNLAGTTDLVVNIGGSVEAVSFNVVERRPTQFILWFDYCYKHIESNCPRQRVLV